MFSRLLGVFVLAGLMLSACSSSGAQQSASDSLAQGKAQFISLCASCHSIDGTGSDLAPSVIGHAADVINAQIRNPEGEMPAFTTEMLSDADLDLLIQYVLSLGSEEAMAMFTPTEQEKVHLTAAYEAIADYQNMDRDAAINHLQQAVALASGAAAEKYAKLIDAIEAGKAGTARHELEEILGIMDP